MFRDFFKGRYGLDTFGLTLMIIALLLTNIKYVWILGFALFIYVLFRMLSKNISQRYREQQKFNQIAGPAILFFKKTGFKLKTRYKMFQQRKQYIFVRCPKCKGNLRLPRHKGKLQVTCPVCKTEFLKKT